MIVIMTAAIFGTNNAFFTLLYRLCCNHMSSERRRKVSVKRPARSPASIVGAIIRGKTSSFLKAAPVVTPPERLREIFLRAVPNFLLVCTSAISRKACCILLPELRSIYNWSKQAYKSDRLGLSAPRKELILSNKLMI